MTTVAGNKESTKSGILYEWGTTNATKYLCFHSCHVLLQYDPMPLRDAVVHIVLHFVLNPKAETLSL